MKLTLSIRNAKADMETEVEHSPSVWAVARMGEMGVTASNGAALLVHPSLVNGRADQHKTLLSLQWSDSSYVHKTSRQRHDSLHCTQYR